MIINKIFLCLALSNLSNTDFKMKKTSLKTACHYSEQIVKTSKKEGLSPFLISSMIWVESRFEKSAVSNKGACGLTQVLSKYSKYSCKELKNPSISIKQGISMLSYWVKTKKNMKTALECYNSGYYCTSPFYSKLIIKKSNQLKKEYKKVQKMFMENKNE